MILFDQEQIDFFLGKYLPYITRSNFLKKMIENINEIKIREVLKRRERKRSPLNLKSYSSDGNS